MLRSGYSRADLVMGSCFLLLLGALLVVGLSRQSAVARRNFCEHKQFELTQAIQLHELIQGELPGWREPSSGPKPVSTSVSGWPTLILPWVGRSPLPEEASRNTPVDTTRKGPRAAWLSTWQETSASERTDGADYLSEFVCAADLRLARSSNQRQGWLSFVVNAGRPDEAFPATASPEEQLAAGLFLDYTNPDLPHMKLDFIAEHDGESYTLLLGENTDAGLWHDQEERQLTFLWNEPDSQPSILPLNQQAGAGDGSVRFARLSSGHGSGANVTFVAGNTQFLSQSIDPRVLQQLMTSSEKSAPANEPAIAPTIAPGFAPTESE